MSLSDWSKPTTTFGPLTAETLNKAFAAMAKRGIELRHDCRLDGHVAHFGSVRCVHCGEAIRSLTPDETHLLLGEFSP